MLTCLETVGVFYKEASMLNCSLKFVLNVHWSKKAPIVKICQKDTESVIKSV